MGHSCSCYYKHKIYILSKKSCKYSFIIDRILKFVLNYQIIRKILINIYIESIKNIILD